jgi:hypothetical protein
MVHFVKSPQEINAMLQSVSPVDQEVTEEDYFNALKPEWLGFDFGLKRVGDDSRNIISEVAEGPDDNSAPQHVLPGEKAKIQ